MPWQIYHLNNHLKLMKAMSLHGYGRNKAFWNLIASHSDTEKGCHWHWMTCHSRSLLARLAALWVELERASPALQLLCSDWWKLNREEYS
jgi:hypothetical protein